MNEIFSEIIDSKAESSLLGFLLVAPKRTFSIKELAKRLPHSATIIGRAAADLQRKNMLNSVSKGTVKFYYLNERNRSLEELRREFRKVQSPWSDELFSSLKKLGQLEGIYLSGLFVAEPQLPVDILLVGKVNLSKLDEFLKNAVKVVGAEINYSIMTKEEFELRKGTFDRFIKDIFDYNHIVVHEGKPKTVAGSTASKQVSSSSSVNKNSKTSANPGAKKVVKKTSSVAAAASVPKKSLKRSTAKQASSKSVKSNLLKKAVKPKKAAKRKTAAKQKLSAAKAKPSKKQVKNKKTTKNSKNTK